jgi:NADP-dependent 3-hydroxy acid dehydrogenase YdfG
MDKQLSQRVAVVTGASSGIGKEVAKALVAHSVHPGTVDSNFACHADESTQARIKTFSSITPVEGADTVLWLATADEAGTSNGSYFYERQPRKPDPFAEDDANVERLWQESEKIVAAAGT